MQFPYSSTTRNARDNLILAAALELNHLYQLSSASPQLSRGLSLFKGDDGILELLNQIAYRAISKETPDHHAEWLRDELEQEPIDLHELNAVLSRPIGDGLEVFQRKQT